MRPFFCKNRRWLLKYFISIPLFFVILFNIQLISQIKEYNSFKSIQQSDRLDIDYVNANSNNRVNATRNNLSIDNLHKLKAPLLPWTTNKSLLVLIESLNANAKIRNRHFIEKYLNENSDKNEANEGQNHHRAANKNVANSTISTTAVYKAPEFLVLLVQVHSRLNYLNELILSLNETKHIEQTLVIFSHDVYDAQMNKLIESIDFCATLQIFYPYSLQIFRNEFPGAHPNDCPKNLKKSEALILNCNNAAFPDSYGNYREAQVVQIKHHWFWKLAFIFEKLNETKHMKDVHVLLLEEDHYLMPDSIHVLRKLTEKILSDIDVVSLALFEKSKQNLEMNKLNKYAKAIWHTSFHNTGLLLARPQWKMIKDCSHAFCTYDDYNWDWTLQYLSQKCFKLPLVAIFPVSSRVIHIGTCGTHHRGKNCDPKDIINVLKKSYETKEKQFFANTFDLDGINTGIHAIKNSNGGWSDPRDHQLCKLFLEPNLNSSSTTINI